eukprot:scaffold1452_cov117-Isochrysis_galbana.AAC.17
MRRRGHATAAGATRRVLRVLTALGLGCRQSRARVIASRPINGHGHGHMAMAAPSTRQNGAAWHRHTAMAMAMAESPVAVARPLPPWARQATRATPGTGAESFGFSLHRVTYLTTNDYSIDISVSRLAHL